VDGTSCTVVSKSRKDLQLNCIQLEKRMDANGTTYPGSTYESLETLLIAVSPGYVRKMGEELAKRFAGAGPDKPRWAGYGEEEEEG
jgi:hypothetical protein